MKGTALAVDLMLRALNDDFDGAAQVIDADPKAAAYALLPYAAAGGACCHGAGHKAQLQLLGLQHEVEAAMWQVAE